MFRAFSVCLILISLALLPVICLRIKQRKRRVALLAATAVILLSGIVVAVAPSLHDLLLFTWPIAMFCLLLGE
jgi:hypothetical protein